MAQDDSLGYYMGRAGRNIGKFAQDVLYMELAPKGLIDYKPSHLKDTVKVSSGRMLAKGAIMYGIGRAVSMYDAGSSSVLLGASIYLGIDIMVGEAMWLKNYWKTFNKAGKEPVISVVMIWKTILRQ